MMRIGSLGVFVAFAALLAACGRSTPSSPEQVPVAPMVIKLKHEGDALARRGEWEAAAVKYNAALNREASDISLRLAYAVALSHLDRRAETVEHFRWVLAHGTPGSQEVDIARSWLVNAGEFVDPWLASRTTAHPATASASATVRSGLKGKTEWPGVEPRQRLVPIRLTVSGDDASNREVSWSRRFRLGESYAFPALPPGKYRLTGEAMDTGTPLWTHVVTVEPDKETVFDLTAAMSSVSPQAFPPRITQ
jgi:hypothetical protein